MTFYLQSQNGVKIALEFGNNKQQFTIGRIPTNSLQIVDPTVSKNHASVSYFKSEKVHVLTDFNTVNGTFVNSQKVVNNKKLSHNDKIQFGRHETIYYFKNSNPQPPKKGKINFKDYHFQLQDYSCDNIPYNVNTNANVIKKPVSVVKPQNNKLNSIQNQNQQSALNIIDKESKQNQSKVPKQTSLNSNFGKTKFERPSGRIKIPDFEQFLQFQQQQRKQNSVINLPISSLNHLRDVHQHQMQMQSQSQPSKWNKSKKQSLINNNNNKVKLPGFDNQLSEQQRQQIKYMTRKKQIEQAQFQTKKQQQQNQRKILQQRLKLQIQKSRNQQNLFKQKTILQRQLMLEHQQIQQQKQKIQRQFIQNQRSRQETNKQNQLQHRQRQEELFQQLQREKQRQIAELQAQKVDQIKQIQQKQAEDRLMTEAKLKEQLDRKKVQLQLQAEALTKQYQTIYKQTIKKMKRQIQKQQQKITEIQTELQKFQQTQNILKNSIQAKSSQKNQLKEDYLTVNSRNKAFLLYASHLQNKIDQFAKPQQDNNYSLMNANMSMNMNRQKTSQAHMQLQESISASRKLLNMKLRERKATQAQIRQLVCQISVLSLNNQDYIDTIMQNHEQIQSFKQVYYQLMQEQKAIQNKWDAEIEEVSDLDSKCKNSRKQIENNRKKINQNLLDNIKKLTEQRIHMLKMMHYADDDKKKAGKFLVQEMLSLQQQIRNIKIDSQNAHSSITSIILMSQQKKRQNEKLSEILFGANSTSHHFDNMKDQINRLMGMIQNQRQTYSVHSFLKASQDIKILQNKIYEELAREKHLKQSIKKDGSIPARSLQKNPLIFFGEVLLKKQIQLDQAELSEKQFEKTVLQVRSKVQSLQARKSTLRKHLDEHKVKQLQKARKFLL